MAEEERKGSKFLKKSKWGKIFKEDDSGRTERQGTFKLNEDVVDFLKPSTEKPKIDIAIAKRWPDAHEVRNVATGESFQPMVYTKPKRRKGLTVSFVRTLPEVIGEGGDESTIPTSEISRQKAMMQRSSSDRRAGSQEAWRQGPRSPPIPQAREPPPQIRDEDFDFAPKPLRRAQTSQDDAFQRRQASPPSENTVHKPSIGRMPTGRSGYHEDHWGHTSPLETPVDQEESFMGGEQRANDRPRSRDRPTINTQVPADDAEPGSVSSSQYSQTPGGASSAKPYRGLSPNAALSPVMQKRREMTKNEGMAFRRASMLIQQGEDIENVSPPRTGASPPQQQTTSSLSSSQSQAFSPSGSGSQPQTALTPEGPNPFADPKYIKRHSRDYAPQITQDQSHAQSLRQTTRQHTQGRPEQPSNAYAFQPRKSSLPTDQLVDPSRAAVASAPHGGRIPQISQPQAGHQRTGSQEQQYRRAVEASEGDYLSAKPATSASRSQNMNVPQASSRDRSMSPALRDRIFESSTSSRERPQLMTKPNVSSSSVNHFSPSTPHSRTNSRDGSPQLLQSAGSGLQHSVTSQSSQHRNPIYGQEPGSRTSLLGPARSGSDTGQSISQESSSDRHATSRSPQPPPLRSAMSHMRLEDNEKQVSTGAALESSRPAVSPQPPEHGNPAADTAYADFAGRVAHMKGVFRLTAEKEKPFDHCTAPMWLRAGLWWYLKGKSGLELMLQQRNSQDQPRELLSQAHVDLAKAWWILSDPLESFDISGEPIPPSVRSGSTPEEALRQGVSSLQSHIKSLALSMGKNRLLPPTQSLIQGQDTRIWSDYPRFTPDAAAILGGNAKSSILVDDGNQTVNPYDMLPLGDTHDFFCYGRFPVEVYLNTEEAETDRIVLPCMLTVLRGKTEYQTTIAIASQSELVNVKVLPRQADKRTLTWSDISWKASSAGMSIRLPRNFDLSVRMQERDFRAVWNLSEYARKVEKSLRPEPDEKLVHEARLAELQYADSSNSSAFPAEKMKGCMALVFERAIQHSDGSGMRRLHRGYRILLITDAGHKTLSSASHEVCKRTPFYFEYLTDSTANGTTAMIIRIREEKRQCRVLLVFPDRDSRQDLYDVFNGLTVNSEETIVAKVALASLNIEPASQSAGISQSGHPALQSLQWQRLGITNGQPDDPNSRIPSTVESESLRIVARHNVGCVTDRLNLGKGELQLRLPPTKSPTVQILRQPQEDFSMSIDTRNAPQQVTDGMTQLLSTIQQQPTIRTLTFASPSDLHTFQIAITGFGVRFDGLASTLGISRRRMVVPIYKKWEASNVRVQLVSKDSVVKLLAFMEDFSHADALCFQVKSTDTFESPKGDSKHNKWSVKLVDAKFSLPSQEKGEQSEEDKLNRRFVNLEGLDYAEEHDDITVSFDSEQGETNGGCTERVI